MVIARRAAGLAHACFTSFSRRVSRQVGASPARTKSSSPRARPLETVTLLDALSTMSSNARLDVETPEERQDRLGRSLSYCAAEMQRSDTADGRLMDAPPCRPRPCSSAAGDPGRASCSGFPYAAEDVPCRPAFGACVLLSGCLVATGPTDTRSSPAAARSLVAPASLPPANGGRERAAGQPADG
jgi:hypothetical protein